MQVLSNADMVSCRMVKYSTGFPERTGKYTCSSGVLCNISNIACFQLFTGFSGYFGELWTAVEEMFFVIAKGIEWKEVGFLWVLMLAGGGHYYRWYIPLLFICKIHSNVFSITLP